MGGGAMGDLIWFFSKPEVLFVFGLVALVVLAGVVLARVRLSGPIVLGIAVAFFGAIIAVNLVMARKATGTFPGVEVSNSYVASQTFDADRTAQEALGWVVEPSYDGKDLAIVIRDKAGLPAPVTELEILVGRTTMAADDQKPEMAYRGGIYSAPMQLAPGAWLIHLTARAADGTKFQQRLDFMVDG